MTYTINVLYNLANCSINNENKSTAV